MVRDVGDLKQAEPLLHKATDLFFQANGPNNVHTGNARRFWGECLTMMGRYEKAERELLAAERVVVATLGPDHQWSKDAYTELARLYEAWNKPDEVAKWQAKIDSDASSDRISK